MAKSFRMAIQDDSLVVHCHSERSEESLVREINHQLENLTSARFFTPFHSVQNDRFVENCHSERSEESLAREINQQLENTTTARFITSFHSVQNDSLVY